MTSSNPAYFLSEIPNSLNNTTYSTTSGIATAIPSIDPTTRSDYVIYDSPITVTWGPDTVVLPSADPTPKVNAVNKQKAVDTQNKLKNHPGLEFLTTAGSIATQSYVEVVEDEWEARKTYVTWMRVRNWLAVPKTIDLSDEDTKRLLEKADGLFKKGFDEDLETHRKLGRGEKKRAKKGVRDGTGRKLVGRARKGKGRKEEKRDKNMEGKGRRLLENIVIDGDKKIKQVRKTEERKDTAAEEMTGHDSGQAKETTDTPPPTDKSTEEKEDRLSRFIPLPNSEADKRCNLLFKELWKLKHRKPRGWGERNGTVANTAREGATRETAGTASLELIENFRAELQELLEGPEDGKEGWGRGGTGWVETAEKGSNSGGGKGEETEAEKNSEGGEMSKCVESYHGKKKSDAFGVVEVEEESEESEEGGDADDEEDSDEEKEKEEEEATLDSGNDDGDNSDSSSTASSTDHSEDKEMNKKKRNARKTEENGKNKAKTKEKNRKHKFKGKKHKENKKNQEEMSESEGDTEADKSGKLELDEIEMILRGILGHVQWLRGLE
jgi:hypothetical protein